MGRRLTFFKGLGLGRVITVHHLAFLPDSFTGGRPRYLIEPKP
jgi:hypothetical protein